MFIEKARDEMKQHTSEDKENYSNDLYLNIKVCLKSKNKKNIFNYYIFIYV